MSSKQKIAISAIGIVLVLAVIGLTIGLVLVANAAAVGNTMKVTYEAKNVACTIAATAAGTGIDEESITVNGKASDSIVVEAAASTTEAGSFAFSDATIVAADGTVTYTFSITNDAAVVTGNEEAGRIIAYITDNGSTLDNVTVTYPGQDNAVQINAGATGKVTIVVSVTVDTNVASLTGNYKLNITQG